jgi:death-on-curing protein
VAEPTFLSVEDVIEIHADTIRHEGGLGGVRDHGLLTSAVMMPQQRHGGQFLHEGVPDMAAAYLFHIVMNHPFHDGSKRAGAMAAFVFLDVNGIEMTASNDELERAVLAVAAGEMSKDELTAWMREHVRKMGRRRRRQ